MIKIAGFGLHSFQTGPVDVPLAFFLLETLANSSLSGRIMAFHFSFEIVNLLASALHLILFQPCYTDRIGEHFCYSSEIKKFWEIYW